MTAADDVKADLLRYLQMARDALLWKLDGLSEYHVRRPMTPTGTNLLGLVKHLTFVELGYFGPTFGRPVDEVRAWVEDDGSDPNWDLWATADESREQILDGYRRAWAVADATVTDLPLDAVGEVSWWTSGRVTLHRILVHVIAETHRHLGHADIVRESIDGAVGARRDVDNLPEVDAAWWPAYRERLEGVAREAGDR
ncbi:DinB family protein [Blastococcus aggregatus]|uniref:DinB family protein n=1 Tax=Blastococcus aggregatus TaxID=38502 RepID=UPI001FE35E65|nr:DinB family protein [Blastococcus aggregatus]